MRIIVKYTREEPVKYISHLDLMRAMQRAMRRGNIPTAFSRGYHPHPLIAFASALPVGVTSSGEYMDVQLCSYMDLREIYDRFNASLPKGIRVSEVIEVDESIPSLMSLIERADYSVRLIEPVPNLANGAADFLGRNEIIVEKQTKRGLEHINLREGIFDIYVDNNEQVIKLSVKSGSSGNTKPEVVVLELLRSMGLSRMEDIIISVHRLDLYLRHKGQWVTPLALERGQGTAGEKEYNN